MPLKIIPPRNKKTKNLYLRGTYLGMTVDKSCGTDKRFIANTQLKKLAEAIERGEYPPREAAPRCKQPTFLSAAVQYLETGHRRRHVAKLIKYFGETPAADGDLDAPLRRPGCPRAGRHEERRTGGTPDQPRAMHMLWRARSGIASSNCRR
jgi:hypothetical protein